MSIPPYRIILRFEPSRAAFVAEAPELADCRVECATRAEALAALEQRIDDQVANMNENGGTPPTALDASTVDTPEANVAVNLSQTLLRELTFAARRERLELPLYLAELIAQAYGARQSRGGRPSREGSDRQRERRGRDERPFNMDDRAGFLEYVRGLEHAQTGTDTRRRNPPRGPRRGGFPGDGEE